MWWIALVLLWANPEPQIVRGTAEPWVLEHLAQEWDDTNPVQVERGYCAEARWLKVADDSVLVLRQIVRAESSEATPFSLVMQCPDGTIPVHVHTPTSCMGNMCMMGGLEAYQCWPSDWDVLYLVRNHHPIGAIQCDRRALVYYGVKPWN